MRKARVLFLSGAVLASIFSFLLFFGTGALNLIPFIRDLMMFEVEGRDTVHFGFELFAYMLTCVKNAKTMIFEPGVLEFYVYPFFCILFGGAVFLIHTVVSCIKLRFEMLLHLIPMTLVAIAIPFFAYVLLGIPFNDGTKLHTYFLMVIFKGVLPVLPRVIFIIILANFVITHLCMLGFFIFVSIAPRRSKKWKALQYEKEFASIREVRTISVEEMKKYMSEHKAEVRKLLGIEAAPALAEPVKDEPAKAEPVIAEPVKEEAKAEKVESAKAEVKPASATEISAEIAKAVAANLKPGTNATTTIVVESGSVKQEIKTETVAPGPVKEEPKKEEAKPVEEKKATPKVVAPTKDIPPAKKEATKPVPPVKKADSETKTAPKTPSTKKEVK